MTEATLTPAAALAERVLEATRTAGHLDVAPGRKASALTALDRPRLPHHAGTNAGSTPGSPASSNGRPSIRSGTASTLLLCLPDWTPTVWSSWTDAF